MNDRPGRLFQITWHRVPVLIKCVGTLQFDDLKPYLPPGSDIIPVSMPTEECVATFALHADSSGSIRCCKDDEVVFESTDLDELLLRFESHLKIAVADHARDCVVVHAGAVAVRGSAILLPGRSMAGKTTIVSEMIRCGADYLSDDFALLDEQGRVHPYPRPLVVRTTDGRRMRVAPDELGANQIECPIPVGKIVFAEYQAGGRWTPQTLSRGQAALRLLDNTVSARRNSELALRVFRRVTETAVVQIGVRGEAADLARQLVSEAT